MQINYFYLYRNQLDVFTSSTESWTQERYRKVYNRSTKVFRDTNNTIDFQVRNSNQQSINLSSSTLVFNLISRTTQNLILQKDCTAVDASIGRFQLQLTERELYDIESGFYDFTLIKEQRENIDSTNYRTISKEPLYINDNYDVPSTLEVLNSVQGEIKPSIKIENFSRINPEAVGDQDPQYFESSLISANPYTETASSFHTFQIFPNNYTGEIVIQGSLDNNASPENWIDLDITDIVQSSQSFYVNVQGKYNYFRIKHTPGNTGQNGSFVIAQTFGGIYTVAIREDGLGYDIGDVIRISGDDLGGSSPQNDLTITVTDIDVDGRMTDVSFAGVSYPGVRTFVKSGDPVSVGVIDKILYR